MSLKYSVTRSRTCRHKCLSAYSGSNPCATNTASVKALTVVGGELLSFVYSSGGKQKPSSMHSLSSNCSVLARFIRMTSNEGVEKPNSEPGDRDLGSYFCRCCLSWSGTVFFLIRHGDLIAAFERSMRRVNRLDAFHTATLRITEPHSHDAPAFQCCALSNTASTAHPLWFYCAA